MDLRLTFNTAVENYDRFRPTYTEELYEDVIRYAGLDGEKDALEIGIGTGQATPPFLRAARRVTAIEIGDELARFTKKKFAACENLKVVHRDFESAPLEADAFDLVYSATAFHWIAPEAGLPKVLRILRPGGAFAWFSNHPAPALEDARVYGEIQKVYQRYGEYIGAGKPAPSADERRRTYGKIRDDRSELLRRYGFADVTDKLYASARTFDAKGYTALLCTYSDHMAMPEAARTSFLGEIADAIGRCGGRFTLADTIVPSMGRKP